MDNLNKLNSFNNLKTLNDSSGNSILISNGISSLNFDGNIPKRSTVKNVSDLIEGDIVTDSDIVKANKSFLITTIEKQTYTIGGEDTDVYFLYYLSDTDGEKSLTYLSPYTDTAQPYYGSYNTDQLFYVFSDDIDNINLGDNGWMISNSGNAIFANGFFRGRIEATEGIFSGTVTAGTENASIKIGKDLFNLEQFPDTGTTIVAAGNEAHGLIIDENNYFFTSIYNSSQNVTSLNIVNETTDSSKEYYATISYISPFSLDQSINPNTLIDEYSNLYITELLDSGENTDFNALNGEWFPVEAGVVTTGVSINGNVSRSGTTATINCTGHGLIVGDVVAISGLTSTNSPLNGNWTVATSANANIFTFTTTTSGTITANTPTGALSTKAGSFKIKLPYQLAEYALNTNIYITGYANNHLFPEKISLVKIKLTEVTVSNVTSTCQLTVGFNPTTKYSTGENIFLTGFTVSSGSIDLTGLNGSFVITALTSSTITVRTSRITAGSSITTGLGSIQDTLQKSNFKVGSVNKYMSYDSDTDILKVTGEINATSGTFNGTVNAITGNIGGFTLSKNSIYSTYNRNYMQPYDVTFSLSPSTYWKAGSVSANSATPTIISGTSTTINGYDVNIYQLGYIKTSVTPSSISGLQALWTTNGTTPSRFSNTQLGLLNNKTYTFSVFAKAFQTGSISARVDVKVYDAATGGNLLGTSTGASYTVSSSGEYTQLSTQLSGVSGAYYEFIIIDQSSYSWTGNTPSPVYTMYFTAPQIGDGYPTESVFSTNLNQSIALKTGASDLINLLETKVNNSLTTYIDDNGNIFSPKITLNGTLIKRQANGVASVVFSSGTATLSFGSTLPFTPSTVILTPSLASTPYFLALNSSSVPTSTGAGVRLWSQGGSGVNATITIHWLAIE